MKHYGIAHWIDLSRGLTTEDDAVAMEAHAADCAQCRETAEYCAKLARTYGQISRCEVPDSLIRIAISVFPVAEKSSATDGLNLASVGPRKKQSLMKQQ
jgi:hypothetical protein